MTTLRMLCRALLAAAILSYVLCVLLLSGVQKEDLDAGTLRKLQRHNVNIDDINDPKLQEQCLSETNASAISSSPQHQFEKTLSEKTITVKDITFKTRKNVETSTKALRKILEYFKNKHKAGNNGVFEPINNAKIATQDIITLITTSPPSTTLFGREDAIKIKSTTGKKSMAVNIKNAKHKNMTKGLEKLMKIWQSNIDSISDIIQSTTLKTIRDDYVSQNAKDLEYISKIVAKIFSSKQLPEVKTNKRSKHRVKETPRHANEKSTAQTVKKTIFPTNYYLNNCKLDDIYKRLTYGTTMPVTDTKSDDGDHFICKQIESNDKETVDTDRVGENTINYILSKLKGENQRLHILDSESVNAIETLQNQPKKNILSRENEHIGYNNYKKATLNILDNESAKALETVLENQSNRVMINQLSQPMNTSTYQEILIPLDNASDKEFESASSSDQHVTPIPTSNINNEKQDNFASFIEESKRIWDKYFERQSTQEPKLKKERTQTITTSLQKPSKQHVQRVDDEDKKWRFTDPSPLNTQKLMAAANIKSLLDNIAQGHQTLTQIQNSVQYNSVNSDIDKHKSPWFYDTLTNKNKRYENKNKGILDTVLFKPQNDEKITNAIDARLESTYRIRLPYFEPFNKNISREHDLYKKPTWFQKDMLLKQPNDRERSHDLKDTSNNGIGWYRNKTPSGLKLVDSEEENFNQVRSQGAYYNKMGHDPNVEFKNDWAYIRNQHSTKQDPNIKEYDEETEYFVNSQIRKNYNYHFPSKPHERKAKKNSIDDDNSRNNLFKYMSKERNIHNTDSKETLKLPTFPVNVLKDIANSIKENVLRDLKTTVSTQINVTPTTTTTSPTTTDTTTPITTTTTLMTTTTTPAATTTTPMKIAIMRTTKTTKDVEGASTITSEEGPVKIQDASKVLDKLMEMFDKINSIKDKIGYYTVDSTRHTESFGYDMTTTALTIDKEDSSVQDKLENLDSHEQSVVRQAGNDKPEHHHYTKSELDRYDLLAKKIQTNVGKVPKQHVVMVQTNSGEIAPLAVVLKKPFIHNIVLTTKPPVTSKIIYKSYDLIPFRHAVAINKEIQQDSPEEQSTPRNQNRDAYLEMPKERQIGKTSKKISEKKSEFPINHKRRDHSMIGRFHEKLERDDAWAPYNEKIPQRIQQPIGKKSKYNDIHFRNFLHTQQKVNAMLENILNSAKIKPMSGQVI